MIKVVCLESGDFSTMIKNENNIPAGYKDSAVGIIPQEWEVKNIEEICDIYVGRDVQKNHFKEIADGKYKYPVYSNTVEDKGLYGYYDYEEYENNTVTVVGRGIGLGTAFARDNGYGAIGRLIVLKPHFNMNNHFLSDYINAQVHFYVESAAIPQLTGEQIATYKVVQPSKEEQQKIVEILRTWDEAIEKQTKLIKALEKRKQALMQRLLSGRTRLPGFTGEWKKKKLMDIGIFLSTNNFPRDKMNETEGTIMNVHYGDILIKYPTIVDLKTINVPYLNNGIKVKSDLLKDGDVIIADTAEDKIVGKAIEIVNIGTHQIVSGLHTFAFRPNESLFVNRFLGYYLNSVGYRKQLESLIQGIKVCSISKSSILNTYISIPLIKEQQAIVNILVSADDEIKRHNTKLSQLRKQKRGLMQQLLTGKKRVK